MLILLKLEYSRKRKQEIANFTANRLKIEPKIDLSQIKKEFLGKKIKTRYTSPSDR